MTIEEFIAARLDEDERIARESDSGDGEWVHSEQWDRVSTSQDDLYTLYHAEHIARHDPARVLRQVAALRAAVEFGAGLVSASQQIEFENEVVAPIAAIWSDHPDYRPEWNTP